MAVGVGIGGDRRRARWRATDPLRRADRLPGPDPVPTGSPRNVQAPVAWCDLRGSPGRRDLERARCDADPLPARLLRAGLRLRPARRATLGVHDCPRGGGAPDPSLERAERTPGGRVAAPNADRRRRSRRTSHRAASAGDAAAGTEADRVPRQGPAEAGPWERCVAARARRQLGPGGRGPTAQRPAGDRHLLNGPERRDAASLPSLRGARPGDLHGAAPVRDDHEAPLRRAPGRLAARVSAPGRPTWLPVRAEVRPRPHRERRAHSPCLSAPGRRGGRDVSVRRPADPVPPAADRAGRRGVRHAQVPHHEGLARRARRARRRLGRATTRCRGGCRGAERADGGPAHAGRLAPPPHFDRRAASALERPHGPHVARRPTSGAQRTTSAGSKETSTATANATGSSRGSPAGRR